MLFVVKLSVGVRTIDFETKASKQQLLLLFILISSFLKKLQLSFSEEFFLQPTGFSFFFFKKLFQCGYPGDCRIGELSLQVVLVALTQ
jgi:hypothetical protein